MDADGPRATAGAAATARPSPTRQGHPYPGAGDLPYQKSGSAAGDGGAGGSRRPVRYPSATASRREPTSSLASKLRTCVCTVPGATNILAAISRVLPPADNSRRTSISRGVNCLRSKRASQCWRRWTLKAPRRRAVASGASRVAPEATARHASNTCLREHHLPTMADAPAPIHCPNWTSSRSAVSTTTRVWLDLDRIDAMASVQLPSGKATSTSASRGSVRAAA